MLLPEDRTERYAVYRNLIREIGASREDRKGVNRARRQKWLTGSEGTERARYNKLREDLDDLASELYSPDSVRFSVAYPPTHEPERWMDETESARDEMHRLWHDTSASLTFNLAVQSAPVWATSILKAYVERGEPTVELVDPSDIGVLREATNDWDKQEALVHWYEMPTAVFRRLIQVIPDAERRQAIWDDAQAHAAPSEKGIGEALGPAMSRLIISASTPTMIGTTNMGAANPAEAMERVDVVRMAELWVWDDHAVRICDTCQHPEHDLRHRKDLPLYQHNFKWQGGTAGDYRKATLVVSSGYEPVLWEPINPLIPEEHPFHDLTLDPVYGYIWGLSRIDELYPLQAWREQRMNQIDLLMQKQVNPPKVGIGVAGTFEEKMARLDRPGANVAFPQYGNTDVKPFTIPMPPDAFSEIDKIDEMFDKAAGRRSRQRQPGMRSGDQVMAEARLAGGPSRNKAMIVEKAAESVATHLLRLQHRCLKRPLVTAKGQGFLLYHIPADFVVKVEGHSASPLYQEEQMSKIAFAASRKWIDADEGIELLNMPNVQVLRAKARRRQAAEAEAQSGLLEAKKHEAESKSIKNLATAKAQRDKVG